MSTGNESKSLSRNQKIAVASIAAIIVVAAAVICFIVFRNRMLANTMRLLRVQGTVNLEDSKGASKPVIENLRFQSGDALITGSDGLASVGMDDSKIVTLQNDSRAEFRRKNKQLELKLTKGAVFFNVTQKLKEDEKFEIKTSTMTAGIRGTSGIVYYDAADGNRESLMVTDGTVEVSATNPNDNVTRTVKVEGGKKVKVYFYEDDKLHDSVEFVLEEITEEDLSRFTLEWLANDEELLDRISGFTGWDKDNLKKALLGLANNTEPTVPTEPTTEPTVPTQASSETTPAPTPTPTPTPAPKKPAKKKKKKSTVTYAPVKKKKKTSSAPSIPSGWSKYSSGWGTTYNGHKVYIIHQNNEIFKGYLNKKWVELDQSYNEEDSGEYMYFYSTGASVYYKKKVS